MKLTRKDADVFVADGTPLPEALTRCTHMGIGAHQDDLEVMAYTGIADCYHGGERWFAGVVATNGAGSSRTGEYAAYSDEEMRRQRVVEQHKAAAVGEYGCMIQLMYPSAEIKDAGHPGPVADLTRILQTAEPEVLYLHNPADKHDTHIATLLRSLSALRELPAERRPAKVYGVEVWRSLDWLLDADKAVLRADRYPNLAAALIGLFDSQISGGKRYDVAIAGRRSANATFFDSHSGDDAEGLSWAIDLTPLVQDDTLSIERFTLDFIDRFREDVRRRLGRFR